MSEATDRAAGRGARAWVLLMALTLTAAADIRGATAPLLWHPRGAELAEL